MNPTEKLKSLIRIVLEEEVMPADLQVEDRKPISLTAIIEEDEALTALQKRSIEVPEAQKKFIEKKEKESKDRLKINKMQRKLRDDKKKTTQWAQKTQKKLMKDREKL